jgi:hypothetical protein
VAAIAPPVQRDFAGPSQSNTTGPNVNVRDKQLPAQATAESDQSKDFHRAPVEPKTGDEDFSPGIENRSLVQQFFAGETLLAQLKTVLACVGALAFAFHGGRMLVRTTISSAKLTGKRRRQ